MYKLFDGQIKYWHKPSSPFLRAATMGWTPICVCTLIPQPMIWTASTFKSARVSFGASTFQFCSSLFRFVCVFCFLPSLRVRSGDLGSSLGYVLFYWIVSLFYAILFYYFLSAFLSWSFNWESIGHDSSASAHSQMAVRAWECVWPIWITSYRKNATKTIDRMVEPTELSTQRWMQSICSKPYYCQTANVHLQK